MPQFICRGGRFASQDYILAVGQFLFLGGGGVLQVVRMRGIRTAVIFFLLCLKSFCKHQEERTGLGESSG